VRTAVSAPWPAVSCSVAVMSAMNFSLEKSVYSRRHAMGTGPPIGGLLAPNGVIITHGPALLSLPCKNSWLMQSRRQSAINAV
jgi:hypothetical protein